MKTKKAFFFILGTVMVLTFVLSSCSTTKKTAIACPPGLTSRTNKVAVNHKRIKNNTFFVHNRENKKKQFLSLARKNQKKDIELINKFTVDNIVRQPGIENISHMNKFDYSKGLLTSMDNALIPSLNKTTLPDQQSSLINFQSVGCDTIILKSGATILGKVEEIGLTEVKYRKCNNLNGPIVAILKSDVSVILYTNGTHEILTFTNVDIASNKNVTPISSSNNAIVTDNNTLPKTEGLGLAGFVSSLAGLFVAAIPLGIVAIIFGGISLGRINRSPHKYKGKGFAIVAILLGIIDIVVVVIALG